MDCSQTRITPGLRSMIWQPRWMGWFIHRAQMGECRLQANKWIPARWGQAAQGDPEVLRPEVAVRRILVRAALPRQEART
jgi:hypothetical protein